MTTYYQVIRFMHVINLTSLIGSCAYELLEVLNDLTTSVSFTNQPLTNVKDKNELSDSRGANDATVRPIT